MFRHKCAKVVCVAVCCALLVALISSSCKPSIVKAAVSNKERITSPDNVPRSDMQELVAGNNAFAFELYQALRIEQEGNLFFSPYSISSALAMVYAGARGRTAQQIAGTLHFSLLPERLHPAFNALDLELTQFSQAPVQGKPEQEAPQLSIANALWGQVGYSFLPEYLDTLALYYGAGVQLLDFEGNPEAAVKAINQWASDNTAGRIPEVLSSIPPDLRLLLANAVYFNGKWEHPFPETDTRDEIFNLPGGGKVTVPMMHQRGFFRYTSGEAYQAIQLPYSDSGLAMFIVLPASGRFEEIDAAWSSEWVQNSLRGLARHEVILTMPRFSYDTPDISLAGTLSAMGMRDAFTSSADLSGMDGTDNLYVGDVAQKAFVDVNERGTEAAAVTTVFGIEVSKEKDKPQPIVMRIDRPFLFTIRDTGTGATLFVGRVMDPTVR